MVNHLQLHSLPDIPTWPQCFPKSLCSLSPSYTAVSLKPNFIILSERISQVDVLVDIQSKIPMNVNESETYVSRRGQMQCAVYTTSKMVSPGLFHNEMSYRTKQPFTVLVMCCFVPDSHLSNIGFIPA